MTLYTMASSFSYFKSLYSTKLFTVYVNWVETDYFEKQMLRLPFPPSPLLADRWCFQWDWLHAAILAGLNSFSIQVFFLPFLHAACLSSDSLKGPALPLDETLAADHNLLYKGFVIKALSSTLAIFFLLHVYIPHIPTSNASLHDPCFVTIPRLYKYLRACLFSAGFVPPCHWISRSRWASRAYPPQHPFLQDHRSCSALWDFERHPQHFAWAAQEELLPCAVCSQTFRACACGQSHVFKTSALLGSGLSLHVTWQPFPTLPSVPSFHYADVTVGKKKKRERKQQFLCKLGSARIWAAIRKPTNCSSCWWDLTYFPS